MVKALLVVSVLTLAAVIAYSTIITLENNTLKDELESTQDILTTTQVQLNSTEQSLTAKETELISVEQILATIEADMVTLNNTLSAVQDELDNTQAQLEEAEATIRLYEETLGVKVLFDIQPPYLKESIGNPLPLHISSNPVAIDPTWQELITFLLADPTDNESYQLNTFECANSAEMLHNNAEAAGIKAAFVVVFFSNEDQGHALNAFRTTDRGLAYVDCTGPTPAQRTSNPNLEWDKIAYIVKGKEYGSVSISLAVYPEYSYYEQIGQSSGSGWLPLGITESIEIYW